MSGRAKKLDPWAAYGGLGSELVTILKRDVKETKCCGVVCLPGVFTRLAIARLINEAVEKRVAEERETAIAAVVGEREACAKIADFWAGDEGLSPCHGDGNRFGQKVAGRAIAESIRARARGVS